MTDRRKVLKSLALGAAALPLSTNLALAKPKKETQFLFSLNTSTISGQKLGLVKTLEAAARAGYDGVEVWLRDIDAYLEQGGSLSALKKLLDDSGLQAFNAIGFATWMAQDPAKSKEGFALMEKEMNMLAAIGCTRVAAPAIGTEAPVDLFEGGEKYAQLIDLGRKTGVMPQLEFWGAYPPFYHLSQALAVAAAANDPDARLLPDIYHLFRGGSGFEGLKLINGEAIEVFHLNDFSDQIPRLQQQDKDRVYPGDGVAPLDEVMQTLKRMGGTKILSLELFNPDYWAQDADLVAKTGLEKMKQLL
ncbi:sugar phosphate isomerase/epimerase family protein [Algoriphagus namhaensis]